MYIITFVNSCKWECEPGDIPPVADRCEFSLGTVAWWSVSRGITLCSGCHTAQGHFIWGTGEFIFFS